jgi:putative copper export protein
MLGELIQFVGYFLAIGALGFRFGIVRRARGLADDARAILRADNAAMLGLLGVVLLVIATFWGPVMESMTAHKSLSETLPKDMSRLNFKLAMLALAFIGFATVRAAPKAGWVLALIGVLFTVLQPLYTGRTAGKVNAVHILAASTWLGTLLVLTIVGIRGVIGRAPGGSPRSRLVADLVNSFSPLALTAASIVALTGATTAWLHLKRISALYTTSYGKALIVKLILVAIVVSLGGWNWRRVRPTLGEPGTEETIRRSSTMELTFAALVLIATAVLVTLPSPR